MRYLIFAATLLAPSMGFAAPGCFHGDNIFSDSFEETSVANLLTNGDFSSATGWTLSKDDSNSVSEIAGSQLVLSRPFGATEGQATLAFATQSVPVTIGNKYVVGVNARFESFGSGASVRGAVIADINGVQVAGFDIPAGGTFWNTFIAITASTAELDLGLRLETLSNGQEIVVENAYIFDCTDKQFML